MTSKDQQTRGLLILLFCLRRGKGREPAARLLSTAFLASALALTACQPSSAPGPAAGKPLAGQQPSAAAHSPEVQRLLDAAKAAGENELSLAWSEEALGGHEGAKRLEALFNKMYGTSLTFNFTPGPSMTDLASRVGQEVAAGRKASTDVFLGTESHFGALVNREVLEEYDYTALSPRIIPQIVALRNVGVEVGSIVSGITYNTNLVSPAEAPKRLEEVLNPKWSGTIASTQNAAIFDRLAARPEWGTEQVKDFVGRLSPHIGAIIRCGEIARLAGGEFSMLVLDCGSFFVRQAQAKGAPLGHVIPENAGTMGFLYLGVPRNSARPNLGKLFVNTVLSEEGQKIVYETYLTDHPDLPGSQSAAELSELKSKGVSILRVDVKFVAERPDVSQLNDDLVKILRESRGR